MFIQYSELGFLSGVLSKRCVTLKDSRFFCGRLATAAFVAVYQRKETLLVEYKRRGKVSTFMDKRIGENDPEMSVDDKMLKRFAAERQVSSGTHVWLSFTKFICISHVTNA